MTYRVVQWSLGSVGRHALTGVLASRDLELVGVYTHDLARAGHDAGDLCGYGETVGITATSDMDALLALEPDCVLYTAVGETRPKATIAELVAILSSGANVVSSALMDAYHPPSADPRFRGPISQACADGGATIMSTGIDPGFSGDAMPLAALQMCRSVRTVRVQELSTYGGHPDPMWALPYGFGQPRGAPSPILDPGIPTRFWGGMVRLLAEILDVTLDDLTETVERCYAETEFEVPMGPVPKGSLAAVRFEVAGIVNGEPRLFAEHVTRMRDDIAPDWPRPPSGTSGIHRVEIEGDPSLRLDLTFTRPGADHNDDGVIGTAARLISAIPAIVQAEPGIMSALDLPLARGRNILSPTS